MTNVPPLLRVLLWPFSALYGVIAQLRAWLYARGILKQKRLRGTVISVGNLTVGGTGKTPLVLWLAERYLAEGKRVAILIRGYKGTDNTSDEVEVLRGRLGDRVPIGVGKSRYQQGRKLEAQGYDLFLLDDGFQHLQLARDVDIALIDCSRPLHMESLLPAGLLREPLSALNRADLVVFTRVEAEPGVREALQRLGGFPIFPAETRLLGFQQLDGESNLQYLSEIGPGPFFPFCGIGNPESFFSDLQRWHVPIAGRRAFRDHHRYSRADAQAVEAAAEKAGATALVTTEKDACNLRGVHFSRVNVYVAVIEMKPNSESAFLAAIESKLSARREATA